MTRDESTRGELVGWFFDGGITHCMTHGVDEPTVDAYHVCRECRHAFLTEIDLVETFNREVVGLLKAVRAPGRKTLERITEGKKAPFCPYCTHDFFFAPQ